MGSWLGTLFIIILVVSWIVKGLSALTGNDQATQAKDRERKQRSLEDWDQEQARRRAEMAKQSRQGEVQTRFDQAADPSPDLSQMTMAERIELARQRARQQGGGQPAPDPRREAQRRARAEREQAARRRSEQVQAQQREQRERAIREREQLARRRAAEERARQRQRDLQQARGRRQRGSARPKRAATTPLRQPTPSGAIDPRQAASKPGTPQLTSIKDAKRRSVTTLGKLDAASLRRAFIMKELLDKPVALRSPQDDLLS